MRTLLRLEALRAGLVRGLVLVGLGSLALMGPMGLRLSLAALALVAGCWALQTRPTRRDLWKIANTLVSAATLIVPILFPVTWKQAGMFLLAYLQVHRARTGQEPRDDRFALLFATLMVLLASGDSRSPWLGLMLLALAGALPVALIVLQLYQVERERGVRHEPLGAGGRGTLLVLLAPASVLITTGFFLVIPRLHAEVLAEYGAKQEVSGFSGELTLGELGEIKTNEQLVFRAEVRDHRGELQRGPFYFRGLALDHFDGSAWKANDPSSRPVMPAPPALDPREPEPGQLRVSVLTEPFISSAGQARLTGVPLFTMREVEDLFSDDAIWLDPQGGYRFDSEPRRRVYTLYVRPPLQVPGDAERLPPRLRATGLQLPSDLDPRIDELARQVVGEVEDPWAKAAKLERYLHGSYQYTLVPDVGDADQPLSVFLFDSRRGHCEYFATALAVLLREEGVPARIVNGFYTDEFNVMGGYVAARQSHAHSWVEAWIGGRWIRLDATPAGVISPAPGELSQLIDAFEARWYGLVVDYDLGTQLAAVRTVGRSLGGEDVERSESYGSPEIVGTVALLVGFVVSMLILTTILRRLLGARTRKRRLKGVAATHARARRLVARRGWEPPPALPPVESAQWLAERCGGAAEPLEELAWLHYRARYAGESGGEPRARELLLALRDLPRAARAG